MILARHVWNKVVRLKRQVRSWQAILFQWLDNVIRLLNPSLISGFFNIEQRFFNSVVSLTTIFFYISHRHSKSILDVSGVVSAITENIFASLTSCRTFDRTQLTKISIILFCDSGLMRWRNTVANEHHSAISETWAMHWYKLNYLVEIFCVSQRSRVGFQPDINFFPSFSPCWWVDDPRKAKAWRERVLATSNRIYALTRLAEHMAFLCVLVL